MNYLSLTIAGWTSGVGSQRQIEGQAALQVELSEQHDVSGEKQGLLSIGKQLYSYTPTKASWHEANPLSETIRYLDMI